MGQAGLTGRENKQEEESRVEKRMKKEEGDSWDQPDIEEAGKQDVQNERKVKSPGAKCR